ncbi:MAG: PTS sugar transporter subunit IIA, partial [Phycisphaerae bacterium]|nr:PTS sugar transporter subunit IIA [Phycisphaerae bacterium]
MDLAPALERGVAVVAAGPLELDEVLGLLAHKAAISLQLNERDLHEALRLRERVRPTALPEGVALPHAILNQIPRTLVVPAVVSNGVVFDPSLPPATVIISLFGNLARPWDHIKMLARVA